MNETKIKKRRREADMRSQIDAEPMTRFQILVVAICVVLNMLDGFDVLVMAFTAQPVSAEWQLNGKQLGVLLSAGLFGMAAGSMFLAPWGDRYGRRAVTLAALALISIGLALSAAAQSANQLAACRVLTGFGIGGILASINVITSEYSNRRWRNFAISVQATGYPIGATLGGAAAAILIHDYGWRSAFLSGAVASALMIPAVAYAMPESLDFLVTKRPRGALTALNRLMRFMRRAPLDTLPLPRSAGARPDAAPFPQLFSPTLLRATLSIWAAYFLVMLSFYFVLSWTPKLLVQAGLTTKQGITGGVLLNVGGIFGGIAFGYLSARLGLRRVAVGYFLAAAASLVAFGLAPTDLSYAFPLAAFIGVFIFGSMISLYALTPGLYPAAIRATGMGWAIGIGRLGAILAPLVAGALVDATWPASRMYFVFALPLLGAMGVVLALRDKRG